MRILAAVFGLCALLFTLPLQAQDKAWLQIEAQPSLAAAMDRARAYAALFPDVEGYKLGTGWYGIALGPATKDAATARLASLLGQNMIPADSYLSDGASFGQKFWPVGADNAAATAPATTTTAPATAQPASQVAPVVPAQPEETLKEARAAEAALSPADRQELQNALKWYGFYVGPVDGAIGKSSRVSMAAWQAAQGHDQTGVLSTKERVALTGQFRTDQVQFGFATVSEAESGIEITLPTALIQFDRYEPPFVRYKDKAGSGLQVMLISEPGGQAGLSGLYDVLQSLEIVPPEGERGLNDKGFTIHAKNDKIETLVFAALSGDAVKGYLVSWNLADADRMKRILPAIQASFHSLGDKSLDPGLVPLADAAKRGLLSGLEVRHPKYSRTGFFIDAQGSVLTALPAVTGCGKIVLERGIEATVSFSDPATGIAVLTPAKPLAPKAVAAFAASAAQLGTKVSVSGYSYEDRLPAPVMTIGTVEDTKGLNGETGLTRLTLSALPGDAGGPVFDDTGAVLGMLLPADPAATKQLPQGVAFAASADELMTTLTAHGLTPAASTGTNQATPDALNAAARGMTVLVSCWQ